jgi:hypothetical protein
LLQALVAVDGHALPARDEFVTEANMPMPANIWANFEALAFQ